MQYRHDLNIDLFIRWAICLSYDYTMMIIACLIQALRDHMQEEKAGAV